jgi:hypothetical protein
LDLFKVKEFPKFATEVPCSTKILRTGPNFALQPNLKQPNFALQPNLKQPNLKQPNLKQPNLKRPNFALQPDRTVGTEGRN